MTDAPHEQPTTDDGPRRLPPAGSPQETRLHLTILDLHAHGLDVAHMRKALRLSGALLAHAKRDLLAVHDAVNLDHAMVIAARNADLPAARNHPPSPSPPTLPRLHRAVLDGWAHGHRRRQTRRELGLTEHAYDETRAGLLALLDATHRTQALLHALRWNLLDPTHATHLRTESTMDIVTHTVSVPNGLLLTTVVDEHKAGSSPGREWGTFRGTSCDTATAAVVVGDPDRVDGASGTLAEAAVYGGALHAHLRGLQDRDPRAGAVLLRLTFRDDIHLAIVGAGAAYTLHTDGTATCHSQPTEGTLALPDTARRIMIGVPGLPRHAETALATAILTESAPERALRQMIRATERSHGPGTQLLLELPTA
ncbi:hypothetical protein OG948_59485 (plasmid) [Embleya sp. NBC_00888]|uniref:hypothetical protein n=1 Tax=Embleya sp. NBC_00888 TaxID=2975960 RepID=UPI002F90D2DE|nr:hypothetical protein OG948_59485 [Embleya sp. NBC_00888]